MIVASIFHVVGRELVEMMKWKRKRKRKRHGL